MTPPLTQGQKDPLALIVVGTRPEIIKVAPIVRASLEEDIPVELVHTGQHYSYELDSIIFRDLDLGPPRFNLRIGSGTHAEETSKALVGLEDVFRKVRPDIVLVQGDTNSALAGALAAAKMHIHVGHIEAGLRSFDRRMPEETNRVLTDHISDILFAPTEISAKNLLGEGIPSSRTLITGNTIVDAVNRALQKIPSKSKATEKQSMVFDEDFLLLTLHREENVDMEVRLRNIIKGVGMASKQFGTRVLFPAHPRTTKRIQQFGIVLPETLAIVPPLGFLDFVGLERNARLILTDSGGVQEEACILGVPCVTLRENTERPETVAVGANLLAGTNPKDILHSSSLMIENSPSWTHPFGDGLAGKRIFNSVIQGDWSKPN